MSIIHAGRMETPIYSYKRHQDAEWEMVYYTYGSGIYTSDSEAIPFKRGDLIITEPNIFHAEKSDGGYKNIFMYFTNDILSNNFSGSTYISDNEEGDLGILADMIYRYAYSGNNYLKASVEEAAIAMAIKFADTKICKSGYVSDMKKIIDENLSNVNFDLEDMYRQIYISPNYARKLFKAEIGCTPISYLNRERINLAKELLRLRNGRILIRNLAEEVGFNDEFYFSRTFKSVAGMSPDAYREQIK